MSANPLVPENLVCTGMAGRMTSYHSAKNCLENLLLFPVETENMKDSRPPEHHREGVYNVYHAEEC